jgi:hypothetical protein
MDLNLSALWTQHFLIFLLIYKGKLILGHFDRFVESLLLVYRRFAFLPLLAFYELEFFKRPLTSFPDTKTKALFVQNLQVTNDPTCFGVRNSGGSWRGFV